jgi:hypothetical protein
MHSWGSRGRRFKSGRPDWFFEHLYPELGTKTAMIVPTGPAGMSKASKAAAAQSLLTQPPETNADHLPPPASSYSVTERSQYKQ